MSIDNVFEVSIIVVFFILGALFGMFILHPVFGDIILPSSRDSVNHPLTENLPPAFCCQQFFK